MKYFKFILPCFMLSFSLLISPISAYANALPQLDPWTEIRSTFQVIEGGAEETLNATEYVEYLKTQTQVNGLNQAYNLALKGLGAFLIGAEIYQGVKYTYNQATRPEVVAEAVANNVLDNWSDYDPQTQNAFATLLHSIVNSNDYTTQYGVTFIRDICLNAHVLRQGGIIGDNLDVQVINSSQNIIPFSVWTNMSPTMFALVNTNGCIISKTQSFYQVNAFTNANGLWWNSGLNAQSANYAWFLKDGNLIGSASTIGNATPSYTMRYYYLNGYYWDLMNNGNATNTYPSTFANNNALFDSTVNFQIYSGSSKDTLNETITNLGLSDENVSDTDFNYNPDVMLDINALADALVDPNIEVVDLAYLQDNNIIANVDAVSDTDPIVEEIPPEEGGGDGEFPIVNKWFPIDPLSSIWHYVIELVNLGNDFIVALGQIVNSLPTQIWYPFLGGFVLCLLGAVIHKLLG